MLIGDAVYEVDSATGEVMYDLPMGTVVDFYWDEPDGETLYNVRWDGNKTVDQYGYYPYELKKEALCSQTSLTARYMEHPEM